MEGKVTYLAGVVEQLHLAVAEVLDGKLHAVDLARELGQCLAVERREHEVGSVDFLLCCHSKGL